MEVVVWSLAVLAITITLAQILRRILRIFLREEIFKIVDEFLAAMQCSIGILECGVVSGAFGPWSWFSIMSVFIFSTVKHFTFIKGKYVANPCSFIDRFYNAGKVCPDSPAFIIAIVGAQLIGALFAHPVSRLLWGKTYSTYHNTVMFAECQSTLEVPFLYGFGVEFFTTFIAWASDSMTPIIWKPPVRSAVSISLALTFMKTSGAWMNPAAATAHTFNCTGHDNPWEHFVAYWLGPYMAVIVLYEVKELWKTIKENRKDAYAKSKKFDDFRVYSYATADENLGNGNTTEHKVTKSYTNGAVLLETEIISYAYDEKIAEHQKYSNGLAENGRMHFEATKETKVIKDETVPMTPVTPNRKYHRSAGGSLRPRVPSIGPG
eukprot:Seg5006.2 transcript_id=Seg5006.2/GoldUCD/mRNA.D3Y31 product=Aquaporin-11 protein_id=Seg5006.2/GoldUCD/D3Y31